MTVEGLPLIDGLPIGDGSTLEIEIEHELDVPSHRSSGMTWKRDGEIGW